MTTSDFRSLIPWLAVLLLIVGLVQAMAVVPALEAFIGPANDYLHENIMGIMLLVVAVGMLANQTVHGLVVGAIVLAAVAIANLIFGANIGSRGWLALGFVQAVVASLMFGLLWRFRRVAAAWLAVRGTRRLPALALVGALAALAVMLYGVGTRMDPRLWYFAVDTAIVAAAAGVAVVLERRRTAIVGAAAALAGLIVLVPFYISLLP